VLLQAVLRAVLQTSLPAVLWPLWQLLQLTPGV
jgi:hypothetical protein